VDKLEVPTRKIDRSQGDIHPGGNPHFLFDPERALACAEAIAERMMVLDPGDAENYRKNLARFKKELEKREARWAKTMAAHAGAPIVTYHRSWIYLADWLGLDVVANLEPKPGIAPTPRHVVRVIKLARTRGVKLLLQEDYYPNKTGKLVADKAGAAFVELPGGTRFRNGQSYLEHMDEVVARLSRALER
jgi:zinc/manganese transport system substrate-binding protein